MYIICILTWWKIYIFNFTYTKLQGRKINVHGTQWKSWTHQRYFNLRDQIWHNVRFCSVTNFKYDRDLLSYSLIHYQWRSFTMVVLRLLYVDFKIKQIIWQRLVFGFETGNVHNCRYCMSWKIRICFNK